MTREETIKRIVKLHLRRALDIDPKLKKFIESKPTFLGSEIFFERLASAIERQVIKEEK